MIDYAIGDCPVCGGRLCVDVQYPDLVYCDTCVYPDSQKCESFRKNAKNTPLDTPKMGYFGVGTPCAI